MNLSSYEGKKIALLGFGTEGASTYRFLTNHGIEKSNISILDKNEELQTPKGVLAHLGEGYLATIEDYDFIFVSPGMTHTRIYEQSGKNIEPDRLVSQTQLFFDTYEGTVIGVTGTKGKSTISSVMYETLKETGLDVVLAGNIGKPVLEHLDFDHPPAFVVYELSSFMLEALDSFNIDIGIFNTLYPTHTDEHGGHDAYVRSKMKILNFSNYVLIGEQVVDELNIRMKSANYSMYGKTGTYTRKESNFYRHDDLMLEGVLLQIPGDHNKDNMCSIIGACDILSRHFDISSDIFSSAKKVFTEFGGLEHRLERVGEYHEIQWINDAIATTPQATMAAIRSFGEQINTLFYGGITGMYDHRGVAELIGTYKIKNLVLFPDTGETLERLLDDATKYTILHTRSMEEAVSFAKKHTDTGSIVLLSCGSPSFSCWKNFKEKGRLFKEAVRG